MAAGDLIVAAIPNLDEDEPHYLAEHGDYLLGDSEPWAITSIDGLAERVVVTPRANLGLHDGDATGYPTVASGAITITAIFGAGDAGDMEEELADLAAAWEPQTPRWVPSQLHLYVPGRGHLYVTGHPAQMTPTRLFAGGGVAEIVATFAKNDPTEHPVPGGS